MLPTPTASDRNEEESLETWVARRDRVKAEGKNGNGFGTPLSVALRLLPTPTVPNGSRQPKGAMSETGQTEDGTKRQVDLQWLLRQRLPTPKGSAENYGRPRPNDRGDLQTAVLSLLPPPTARDWKSSHASEATSSANSRPLNEVVSGGQGGLLNPHFVEFLMGYPQGWTRLSPGTPGPTCPPSSALGSLTVERVSRAWGMPWRLRSWPISGGASCDT